eukprot:8004745-Pyramimonas_sp.AAC.1
MVGGPASALLLAWAVARDLSGLGQRCPDVSLSCSEQHCPACLGSPAWTRAPATGWWASSRRPR